MLQQTDSSTEEAVMPTAFEQGSDFESMTDDEIREAVKQEQASNVQTLSLDKVIAAGCVY